MNANVRKLLIGATLAAATLGFAPVLAGPETSPTVACRYFVRVVPGSEKATVIVIPDEVCGPANRAVRFAWKISHNHNETLLRG